MFYRAPTSLMIWLRHLLLPLLVAGCGADEPPAYGATEVRLVNVGAVAMDSVAVLVTGASYFIGTVSAGDSVTVATRPTGETGASVVQAGRADSLYLDVYFENGYGGRVRAEVTADSVVRVDHANRRYGYRTTAQ